MRNCHADTDSITLGVFNARFIVKFQHVLGIAKTGAGQHSFNTAHAGPFPGWHGRGRFVGLSQHAQAGNDQQGSRANHGRQYKGCPQELEFTCRNPILLAVD